MTDLALAGVRVLDLTRGWSGPIGARFMADLGAEVIKIEYLTDRGMASVETPKDPTDFAIVCHAAYPDNDPGEDPYNRYGPFNEYNRNKMSLTLDLTNQRCKEAFLTLVSISDVVIENYSPRVMANFGLDYQSLRLVNPSIIFIAMPGFGMTGPHRHHVSYGTNIEPTAGLSNLIGYPGATPYKSGEAYPDPNAGLHGVAAVLTALFYRRRTGMGQFIDLSQNEAAVGLIGEALLAFDMNNEEPVRMGNRHPYHAPHNTYRCKGEDSWVTITVTNDQEWQSLSDLMGNPSWAREEKFGDQLSRWQYQDELDEHISRWTSGRDCMEVMHTLQAAGVTAAAVYTNRDIVEDPHLKERGYFQEIPHPRTGPTLFSGVPVLLSKTPGALRTHAPMMGEHNDFLLRDLVGLGEEEVSGLKAQKAVVTHPPEAHVGPPY